MTKFKRGMKVEILNEDDGHSGSWCIGMIISGNGRHYTIKYDLDSLKNEKCILERVPRKSIRPCPPLPHEQEIFSCGDIVEIFCKFSWKMAVVTEVLSTYYFSVRLLWTWQEFVVKKDHIRPRLAWKDNKWIMIGKGNKKYEGVPFNEVSKCSPNPTSKKRLSHDDAHVEYRAATKFRAIEKEGRFLYRLPLKPSASIERFHDGSICEIHVGTHVRFPPQNRTTKNIADKGGKNVHFATYLECNESISTSVGSCSILENYNRASCSRDEECCGSSSDAESHYSPDDNHSTENECMEEIHRLERHAYRSTLEALYASGSLNWKKESLMTDLRIFLHISNDEHLTEVRKLCFGAKN